ncbi:MAG: RidA family protein [Salana multivorans]|uniref:RidA family protein n=1 Tax=Salana multivorans TaxID=120377 RepID=UPI0009601783|nr:RidA family protein [Salana multivorans]MBN8883748.1 RidA family protein [Salana multivorans]OJX97426.1 MAG: LysR family transcriptional regulator [Micrococcales bacterium 73-15]
MTTPSARLAALGLELPPVAAPVAAYVPAVRHGDLVHTSGQLPFIGTAMAVTGKVGPGGVSLDDAAMLARTAALNALAAVADVAGGLDNVERILKVTVFVASEPSFVGQPAVANGASTLLGEIFDGGHVRSAVGVAALPLDAAVEIEVVAVVR